MLWAGDKRASLSEVRGILEIEMITSDEVREYFSYSPETGIFCRTKASGRGSSRARVNVPLHEIGRYSRASYKSTRYYVHRLIWLYMTGSWPKCIDHINGNIADNRWSNLRNVTQKENNMNRRKGTRNKSGINGVYWCKQMGKWAAEIPVNGKSTY